MLLLAGAAHGADDAPARPRAATGAGTASERALCLLDGRFEVTVSWHNQHDGSSGQGTAVESSDFAGFFSFGDADNLELMVKLLDFGESVKMFYGQLTNLRFDLVVRDTVSGATRRYANTVGECGAIDQQAFPGVGGGILRKRARGWAVGSCEPSATRLCLLDGRFAVDVTWRNQHAAGQGGQGQAAPLSDLTGAFSFADPRNLELLTKALDFDNRILFLYGALSDLEYTITLTETASGQSKVYHNPAGRYCGGIDDDVLAPPVVTSGPIGSRGGIWEGLGGKIKVRVPAGALSGEIQLTATPRSLGELDPSLDLGSVVELGPAGLVFAVPVEVTLRYELAGLPLLLPPEHTGLVWRAGARWQAATRTRVDPGAREARGEVGAVGVFGVRQIDASAPCTAPEHRQFDFWLGSWFFDDGSPSIGRNEITRDAAGCFVFEDFTNTGYRGLSVSLYSPATGKWAQTYVDTQGRRIRMEGVSDGHSLELYRSPTFRSVWEPVNVDRISFRHEQGTGPDPWLVTYNTVYTRR